MDARTRLLAIRLMEAIRRWPGYAGTLGLEADMKRRSPGIPVGSGGSGPPELCGDGKGVWKNALL